MSQLSAVQAAPTATRQIRLELLQFPLSQSRSLVQLSPTANFGTQPTPARQRSGAVQPHVSHLVVGATSHAVDTPSTQT